MDDKTAQLAKILQESDNIVFFGGAGVSTASGIPDFRSSDGLYSQKLGRNFTPEQLVSHSFFMRYPDDFFDFYKKNLVYPDAEPNDCHIALAKLEEMGRLKAVITQNIDGIRLPEAKPCMSCMAPFFATTARNATAFMTQISFWRRRESLSARNVTV